MDEGRVLRRSGASRSFPRLTGQPSIVSKISSAIVFAFLVVLATGCRKHGSPPGKKPEVTDDKRGRSGDAALLKKIETFTGAPTKIVWSESQNPKRPDPFAASSTSNRGSTSRRRN